MVHISATNWLSLLFTASLWAMLLVFITSALIALKDGIRQLRRLHQIPCHRCQYRTGSAYLKCTVNPISAFSEDALHCRDYVPGALTPCRPAVVKESVHP